ncbi:UNVERIFIED_CONTAM: hypothetical protein GTU68_022464 [Idotea baltica]|nr:hypothetical protein [Idotea baltica]
MSNHIDNELWAVVPAAGSGSRLPSAFPKQYLLLKDRCILQRTIDTLLDVPNIKGVVVCLAKDDALWPKLAASEYPKVLTTVGGDSRAASVIAGLNVVCDKAESENAMVLVHDAARALTATSDIVRLIEQVLPVADQGGLLANKVQDTLKQTEIEKTVSREGLWQAQTPQMFRAELLRDTLVKNQDAIERGDITDEACAMENAGYTPILVEALQPNFKITQSRDLDMALALVEFAERSS